MAAIYQWIIVDDVTVTTTPYPIESSDGVEFSITLGLSILREIQNTDMSIKTVPLNSEMTTVLLSVDVGPTEMSIKTLPLESVLTTILNERTADPTELSIKTLPLDGMMQKQLVTIQAPPRGAEFSITLGNCSLDPV